MDLKEYFSIIGKHVWLLIGVTVIIFLGVLWYSYRTPVTYDSSVFVTAAVKNSGLGEKPNYYDYDNYYSLQGSGFFCRQHHFLAVGPFQCFGDFFQSKNN